MNVSSQAWRAPTSRMLFLDFDGVQHPGESGTLRHVAKLESVLWQNASVDVVISPNWREPTLCCELIEIFSDDMAGRIGRITLMTHGLIGKPSDRSELDGWLIVNKNQAAFVICWSDKKNFSTQSTIQENRYG